MIFVTVGTHEQPFDRLIKKVDELKKKKIIKDDVFIQTGYSNYEPKYCKWKKFLPYSEMNKYIQQSKIIICHGGPATFLGPLNVHKIPIVVPRQLKYGEHVNNHQVDFVKFVFNHNKNIIPVFSINELKEKILNYDNIVCRMNKNLISHSHNEEFNIKFNKEINKLFNKEKHNE